MRSPVAMLIRVYQLGLSPLMPASCRFYPSCSSYALQAIEQHGHVRGAVLAARRIARCHPWNPGGIDPVPGTAENADKACNGVHHG